MRQTEFVVLGLLSESPMTGYQIKKIIDLRFRFFWNESYGQLYPTLKSLTRRGLIEETGTARKGRRNQRTYELKPQGLKELQDWLAQPVERESLRLEILLKMYFSNLVSAETMLGHVEAFREKHQRDLKWLELAKAELESIIDRHPNHPRVLRVVDFGITVNEAYLKWSGETIRYLGSEA
ncbi:MAG: PadR family transcriptional regulator [Dehalococcoidales bacterium]|nr:PadR family transcriptional regulator [Dehalococcoidales bacterium]